MIDSRFAILDEQPTGLFAAASRHPAFAHLCGKSLTRYALRGVMVRGERIKLEVIRVGGRLLTSYAALTRFLEAMNADPPEELRAPRSPSARQRDSERAAKELDAKLAGV